MMVFYLSRTGMGGSRWGYGWVQGDGPFWGGDGPDVVSQGIQPSLGLAARWQPWEGEHRALMAQMGHQHQRPLSQEELAMLVPPSAGCRGPGVCPAPGALRCAPSSWKGSHMGPPAS